MKETQNGKDQETLSISYVTLPSLVQLIGLYNYGGSICMGGSVGNYEIKFLCF